MIKELELWTFSRIDYDILEDDIEWIEDILPSTVSFGRDEVISEVLKDINHEGSEVLTTDLQWGVPDDKGVSHYYHGETNVRYCIWRMKITKS